MHCRICGTPIKAGEKFCSLCGEKAQVIEEVKKSEAQQTQSRQAYSQQAYRQQQNSRQPYERQSYRRSDRQHPYTQQAFEPPYSMPQSGNMYYSSQKRSKRWVWITLSLVAVIAIAAVLVFYVFGEKQEAISQRTLPFKGNTPQTKFVNDSVRVFSDAFALFKNNEIDLNKLAEQPFDLKLDMTVKAMEQSADMTLNAAYDNETLGMNISSMGSSIKMLLIEDIMYLDMPANVLDYNNGSITNHTESTVVGLDYNSTADLTIPMPLGDRLVLLNKSLITIPQSTSNADGYTGLILQSMLSKSDYTALAELFLNCIDEKCFIKNGSTITFTYNYDDEIAALRTFAGKLETNKEMKKMYEDFVRENLGITVDAIKQINDSVTTLEEKKKTDDYELVFELSYKNEKPVSFKIKPAEGYYLSFGSEQNEDRTDITFEISDGSTSRTVSGICNFKKAGSGTEFVGTFIMGDEVLSIYGNIDFNGNNVHGTITVPGIIDMSIDFNLTVNIGMPHTKVKDDGRFKIDTGGATIIDGSVLLGTAGLPNM